MILPEKHNAMYDAIVWANQQTSYKDAWGDCTKPDWLIYMYVWKYGYSKDITLTVCNAAEILFPLIPMWEFRPQLAIDAVRKWAYDFELNIANSNDVSISCRNAWESCSDHGKLSIQKPAVLAITKVGNIAIAHPLGRISMAGFAVNEIAKAPIIMKFKTNISLYRKYKTSDGILLTDIPEYNEEVHNSRKELCNIIRKNLILRD